MRKVYLLGIVVLLLVAGASLADGKGDSKNPAPGGPTPSSDFLSSDYQVCMDYCMPEGRGFDYCHGQCKDVAEQLQ